MSSSSRFRDTHPAELAIRLSDAAPAKLADPSSRHLALRVLLATSVAAAAATASWWPHWIDQTSTGVVNLLVAGSFAATAAVLYEDPEQRCTAREIGLAAAFYLASWGWAWPPQWQASPLPLVSFVLGYLWFVFVGVALTRYPQACLDRRYERVLFGALTGWICGVKLILAATSQAGWAGFDDRAWWPVLAPNREFFDAWTTIFNGGLMVFVLGLLALLLLKIRRGRGLERVDAVPALVAAVAMAVFGVLYLETRIIGLPSELQDDLRIATAVAALATPAVFLAVVVRRQLIRSAAADSLPRIYYASALDNVRDELRQTLRDPDLQLWFWRLGERTYVDAGGTPAEPTADHDRCLVTVRSSDDLPLAVIGMRRSLRRHSKLIESVAHAIGMVLERQAKLEEVRASRARTNEAELTARHDIARDLHDGAQQVLLTARLRLAIARRRASEDPGTMEAIDRAGTDVDSALEVIRGLTAGNDPSLLRKGLAAALTEMVHDIDIPVELQVTEKQLTPSIERNVWFIVSEGITNVRKHAAASTAGVTIECSGGEVVVRIVDDGRGGAHTDSGTGLAGMADRVHALGGRIEIVSPVGHGTTIVTRLPCA